jgi:hydrogenase expression/formation protein HypE
MEDCAFIDGRTAITIDGFTVSPNDFPGGDIGKLAVCGSTNDLAVRGVRPRFLTMSVVLEEGLPFSDLDRWMESAASVCRQLDVALVAGDTKVVPRGAVDAIFISTCAVGDRVSRHILGAANLRVGDAIMISSAPGLHGAALAAARFGLKTDLLSDCAPLWPSLSPIVELPGLRCMRDCTRGGLGTALCEWAEASGLGIELDEEAVPWDERAGAVCDILGFDPLYLASEGCAVIAVEPTQARECLAGLRSAGLSPSEIGRATSEHPSMVGMRTRIGGLRFVDMPSGEILPRIC